VFREPKGRSKRVVPLPLELVPVLRAHRAAQLRDRLAAGDQWHDQDLVFTEPDGRRIDPRHDFAHWKALLAAADVRDARLHDGRHTSATLLLEQGVDVRVVMELLGHSDLRVTQRYTHVASPLAQEATRRMGKVLWGH
jgi:site-specific recombinase XerD